MSYLCEKHNAFMRPSMIYKSSPVCPLCAEETQAWFQKLFAPSFVMWAANAPVERKP